MTHVCEQCEQDFGTERGLKTHVGRMHDPLPREVLVEMYIRENLSARQIADRVGVSHKSVKDRLSKHDLWGKDPVKLRYDADRGYMVISHTGVGGKSRRVRLHRLVAIAAGADPHKVFSGDFDIHHRNEMKLDNRPENLEVLRHDEHAKLHNSVS